MLSHLTIRNIVLIDRLDIPMSPGLGVLTGETGAGKSILLDSLSLALGGRGDIKLIRSGAPKASITAVFDLPQNHPATAILADIDISSGDGALIVRRTLSSDGRGRAFINDQPVSINMLRRLGAELAEIQGQHELHGLLDPTTHARHLDAFGDLAAQATDTQSAYAAWRSAESALAEAESALENTKRDESWLREAVAKLEELDPRAGEDAQLAEARQFMQHAEKLASAVRTAVGQLIGDRGAEASLQKALRELERMRDVGGPELQTILDTLERAAAETGEALRDLQSFGSKAALNPAEAAATEERLFALRAAARRHNVDVDALAEELEELRTRLAAIDKSDETSARLAREVAAKRRDFLESAETLSTARKRAAKNLDKSIGAELIPLKLENAVFRTSLDRLPEGQWSQSGLDEIRFEVRTNPGSNFGPIDKVASGGELARFMLAIKVVLAVSSPARTLVFDEVDSGIGGATAAAVGQRLSLLAQGRQVLVVTHSPQVAAIGDTHLLISKDIDSTSATTRVTEIGKEKRRDEIARMISGEQISDEARAAASELIKGNGPL